MVTGAAGAVEAAALVLFAQYQGRGGRAATAHVRMRAPPARRSPRATRPPGGGSLLNPGSGAQETENCNPPPPRHPPAPETEIQREIS
jgi:hypothetical protein